MSDDGTVSATGDEEIVGDLALRMFSVGDPRDRQLLDRAALEIKHLRKRLGVCWKCGIEKHEKGHPHER